jgi:O-antigen/teichoic acid export membrane protein
VSAPRSVASNAFWMFSWTLVALGLGFVTSVITARVLGPSDRGLLALLQTQAVLTFSILSFGLGPAITYYGARRPRMLPRLFAIGLGHTVVIGAMALVAALAIGDRVLTWKGQPASTVLVILTALVVPASFLQVVSLSMLNATRSYRSVNVLNVVARIACFVVTLICVVALGWGVAGGLAVLLTLSLAFVVGSLPELLKGGIARPRVPLIAAVVRYGGRVQIANIIRLGAGKLDVLLLAWLTGLDTVGVYAVALLIGEVVLQIPRSLGFVVMPLIAADRSGSSGLAARALRLNGTATLVAVLGAATAGPFLILLAFGADFSGALVPFLLLLPGLWFTSAANLAAFVCSGRGRPGLTSLLAGMDAVATILFDVLLIPFFGSIGAAIASSLAGVAFGTASMLALARMDGVPMRSLLVLRRSELRDYATEIASRIRRN